MKEKKCPVLLLYSWWKKSSRRFCIKEKKTCGQLLGSSLLFHLSDRRMNIPISIQISFCSLLPQRNDNNVVVRLKSKLKPRKDKRAFSLLHFAASCPSLVSYWQSEWKKSKFQHVETSHLFSLAHNSLASTRNCRYKPLSYKCSCWWLFTRFLHVLILD